MFSRIITSSSTSLLRRVTWATLPTTSSSSSHLPSSSCTCSSSLSPSSFFSLSSTRSFHTSRPASSAEPSSSSTSTSSPPPRTSRPALISLSNIADNQGARTKRTRVGRGPGSGLGKTAGRGHKGTWARHGLRKPGYEGGQTPSHRTMPKRGFTNIFATPPEVINLSRLQIWIDQGRIRTDTPITLKTLYDSRCITKIKYGVKILGRGSLLKQPIHIEVTDVSEQAKKVIEETGGSVKLVYFNRVGLRHHLKPEKFLPGFTPPGESSIPPPKLQQRYALQGVKVVRARQTAADIAMANIKAAAEKEAEKAKIATATVTTTAKTTAATAGKGDKDSKKKEKKEKKAAGADAATA